MIHLYKIISTFHKDYLEKLIVILPPINSTLPIAKPIIKPFIKILKRKQDQSAQNFIK